MAVDDQYYYNLAYERTQYNRQMQQAALARQQQQQQEELEKNKMSWLTFIPCLILAILADVVEIVTVGTLGWFLGIFVDIILLLVLGLSRSGRKQFKKWLTAIGLEKIPIVGAIPFRTFFLVWSFISSRPKLLGVVQKGLAIASKVPSPIAPELKAVSKAVDIGARLQRAKTAGTTIDERSSALTSAYKTFREANKKAA